MSRHIMASVGLILWSWAAAAHAHELPGSTATVTLRDGLVTIDAHLDVDAWMRAQTARALPAMVASAKAQAESLTVRVDGQPVTMTLQRFPTADEVHRVLQRPGRADHGHHPKVVTVRWRATRAEPSATTVIVRFPEAVGPVLVSFVEPRSRVIAPGGAARFESRRAPSRGDP